MADAGVFFSFLDWVAKGPRQMATVVPAVQEFRYVVVSPGGFQVTAALDEAHVHLVSSFEDAETDAFVLEGVINITYAHAQGRCQFTFDAMNVGLMSHRCDRGEGDNTPTKRPGNVAFFEEDDDQFVDPGWQDRAVLTPSDITFAYAWRVPGTGPLEPATMSLHLTEATLTLPHIEVLMLRTVHATLKQTLRNRPGARPALPQQPPMPEGTVTLNMSVALPSIVVSLGARDEASSLMEVGVSSCQYPNCASMHSTDA